LLNSISSCFRDIGLLTLQTTATDRRTQHYDTIEEINVDSKAEYTA